MIRRRRNREAATADVVAALQEQVRQAQALASVPEQQLLADPRLNPATRELADALEVERLRARLEAEHRRVLRAQRERERQEDEAVRAAAVVDQARAATDPALTVLSVVRSRRRFTSLCLTASLALSVGSAMGLEAAVGTYYPGAPTGIGYLAEVALTGMSTAAIIWSGLLARTGVALSRPVRVALGTLVALPLLASVIGSSLGSGPVGAVASVGSAAFAALSWLVEISAATATAALLRRIDQRTATEEEEVVLVDEPSTTATGDALAVVGDAIADEAAEYLRRSHERPSDHTGDRTELVPALTGAPTGAPDESDQVSASDRMRSHDSDEDTERLPASERRRREGERNRARVQAYLVAYPDASTREIAAHTGLAESTIRRIRRDLRGES
ncbi:hypothetical protein [Thermobifida cellulosilytica]|uniref:Uncharacterized protein n=1 Tax=Thermobifida cellulosilytica TB100 TaxID=665004 RepID=A0A147KM32_THECS|nr:hypothetical protein [Thermobifida cellulosilytica]KUP98395.1 hypothetical protein AC529_01720 [Thermobifida cellulosilytica TB100]